MKKTTKTVRKPPKVRVEPVEDFVRNEQPPKKGENWPKSLLAEGKKGIW
jgi:hypothetical protein